MKQIKAQKNLPPINENIRFEKIQLITHEGKNLGVVNKNEALKLAQTVGLDLVLIADKGSLGYPVTKIMDYGKVLYAKKKKQAEAKKRQKVIQIKEIKMRPKIGEHDFQTKMKKAVQFLQEGKRLKVTVAFRGREMVTKEERGSQMFARIDHYLQEHDVIDIIREKESKMGNLWTRIYYMKSKK